MYCILSGSSLIVLFCFIDNDSNNIILLTLNKISDELKMDFNISTIVNSLISMINEIINDNSNYNKYSNFLLNLFEYIENEEIISKVCRILTIYTAA